MIDFYVDMEMINLKNNEEKKQKYLKEKNKIAESKKIIQEEREKIKLEKKEIKKKRNAYFKKTRLGKIMYLFSNDKNSYSFQEVFGITIVFLHVVHL